MLYAENWKRNSELWQRSVTRSRASSTNTPTAAWSNFVSTWYENTSGEIENRIFKDVQWAEPRDLPKFDFLEADLTLVRDLAAGKLL